MFDLKDNKHLAKYRITSSPDWIYKNPSGSYGTEFIIIEEQVIFESAFGRPVLEDTKSAVKLLVSIINEHFPDSKPHYISDARKIKGADADVRKYVAEFHKNNDIFASISLISGTVTKALFRIMRNLGIGDFGHWKVYRNEKYCIEEILKGEVIIGRSPKDGEYDLIYKALADISNNKFSYEDLINETNSNEELSSVIQALQIINEEKGISDDKPELKIEEKIGDTETTSLLFKSILENTETIVALMNDDFTIINANTNFRKYFDTQETKNKRISQFIDISDIQHRSLLEHNFIYFRSNLKSKTLSCKLYKISNLDARTYTIFIGEDITEKESLRESEKKLLDKLTEQNFKLLKVNHLLSHEINHQIASLSQILEEFPTSVTKDSHLEQMIFKVKDDLNLSLNRINRTLFNTDGVQFQQSANNVDVSVTGRLKVLLIDDDKITNFFNERIVRKAFPDFEISIQTDAKIALQMIEKQKHQPDIILLDLNMPVFNGFDFLKNLTRISLTELPLVFILSSSQDPEEMNKANSYKEVVGYHSKPLTQDKVKAIVNAHQLMKKSSVHN